jgi:hypothetical protein
MSKLTKAQAKAHKAACEILAKDELTWDDRWFVLENWQESATHINSVAGAFFTPAGLAGDFAIDVCGHRIIDLCAGIGALSFAHYSRCRFADGYPEVVCVEKNPDYLAVGRKIFPEATWVEADIFNLPDLGRFDTALSNPPFGATQRNGGKAPRYTGDKFEYHVIDIASDLAGDGVFIIPQMSAPFAFSGQQHYRQTPSDHYSRFFEQTGCELTNGCGVDCDYHRKDWHGGAPAVEIVLCDFKEARARRATAPLPIEAEGQMEMFQEAAE